MEKNDRETYNYMLIRAFLELNDIHDKIAKEQQNYCLGHQEAENGGVRPHWVSANSREEEPHFRKGTRKMRNTHFRT